jgi:tricorn protease-like protein
LAFISADGRYVSFESNATNLVANDNNGTWDVFVHDRTAGTTKRVSVDSSGAEGNDESWFATKVSANGKIAFGSYSTNLVNGDNNNEADVFVHDLNTGETIRVSVDSMGAEANGWSDQHINLSTNGNTVSFASEASNLVANDTNGFMDIFVHDLETGTTDRVSLANDGSEGNLGVSYFNALSADGSVVAFMSLSSNLVAGDTNGVDDIFVRDRNSSSTERVSVTFDGSEANDYSGYPAISGDGNIVLFTSPATNLIPGGTNGTYHTYTYDRTTGAIEIVDVATDGTEANSFSDDASVGGSNNEIIAFRIMVLEMFLCETCQPE